MMNRDDIWSLIDWRREVNKGLSHNYEVVLMWGELDKEAECQIEISHNNGTIFLYYDSCRDNGYGEEYMGEYIRLSEVHKRLDQLEQPDQIIINGNDLRDKY